jgi:DNA (cytosine-5)-methyltransferase 1
VIKDKLENELKYKISYQVVNAKAFVPQNRQRIFIVGFREDTEFTFDDLKLPPEETWPTLDTVLHPEDGSEEEDPPYTVGPKGKVSDKYTLTDHLWKYLQNYAAKHKSQGNGFGFGLVGRDDTCRTLSARYYKDGSEILVKQHGKNPRRLTPRECARLMGFDNPSRPPFEIPVSDTQAYKQFGNAVVVPVVAAIAKTMLPHILKAIKSRTKKKSDKSGKSGRKAA